MVGFLTHLNGVYVDTIFNKSLYEQQKIKRVTIKQRKHKTNKKVEYEIELATSAAGSSFKSVLIPFFVCELLKSLDLTVSEVFDAKSARTFFRGLSTGIKNYRITMRNKKMFQ